MPKTRAQNQEIKDERRANILNVALRLFSVNGYDAVTINDITTKANCSHGLFYHYFPSKAEIFKAIIEQSKQSSLKMPHFEEGNSLTTRQKLEMITKHTFDVMRQDGDGPYYMSLFFNLRFQKTLPPPPKKKDDVNHRYKDPFTALCHLIEEGQRLGEFEPGPASDYALIYFAMIKGLVDHRLNMSPNRFKTPDMDVVMNLFLRKDNRL